MDISTELVLQEPINFNGLIIYQPIIRDIVKYGINEYNNLLLPYLVTIDMFRLSEEQKNNFKVFDLIILNQEILLNLLLSLSILCKCQSQDINIIENSKLQYVIKIKEFELNRDNFDEFADIILKIHAREKPKEDKLPDNPRQRAVELKLREGRKRLDKKNEISFSDIINIVKYGGKYHISNDEIKEMTLWELMNAYKCKLGMSHYEDSFDIYLVSGNKDAIEDHWTKLLKV